MPLYRCMNCGKQYKEYVEECEECGGTTMEVVEVLGGLEYCSLYVDKSGKHFFISEEVENA